LCATPFEPMAGEGKEGWIGGGKLSKKKKKKKKK
jgi:hypothetical protein